MCFVGDATHDQTKQRLKKLMMGFGGSHLKDGVWSNTVLPAIFNVIHQETKKALRITLECLERALRERYGIELKKVVESVVWDGGAKKGKRSDPHVQECLSTFEDFFGPEVEVFLCLEHAKRNTSRRFTGSYKKLVPMIQETLAFAPKPVRHIGVESLFRVLREVDNQEKGLSYLMTNGEGGAFVKGQDGVWDCPYHSDFRTVRPARSTFILQAVESFWHQEDFLWGNDRHAMTVSMFEKVEARSVEWT